MKENNNDNKMKGMKIKIEARSNKEARKNDEE